MDSPKYSLHLFAGAGGGIIADGITGVVPICAVEIEQFPAQILVRRWPNLAIWDDIKTFRADNPDTAAAIAQLRAVAENLVVAGGFPCTDISPAGGKAGIHGKNSSLWFEMARVIREIRPGFVFVENSACLVCRGLGDVLGSLAALGYDAVWGVLGAGSVGAWHRRERIWISGILADATGE